MQAGFEKHIYLLKKDLNKDHYDFLLIIKIVIKHKHLFLQMFLTDKNNI
jgi:hypothetical protein